MAERMLNKKVVPTEDDIKNYIGKDAIENLNVLKNALEKIFDLNIELRFPYGKDYGWSYKLSHRSKHLCDIFFEKGNITAFMQISKIQTEKELEKHARLSDEGKKYWENRYPCGKNGGGWIIYVITSKEHLKDVGIFLSIKSNKEIAL